MLRYRCSYNHYAAVFPVSQGNPNNISWIATDLSSPWHNLLLFVRLVGIVCYMYEVNFYQCVQAGVRQQWWVQLFLRSLFLLHALCEYYLDLLYSAPNMCSFLHSVSQQQPDCLNSDMYCDEPCHYRRNLMEAGDKWVLYQSLVNLRSL